MLRLAADESFDGRIVRGLLRLFPDLDLVRVQDTPLAEAVDEVVLDWAAREERLVLTHDVSTMTAAAWNRARDGLPMPGLIMRASGVTGINASGRHLRLRRRRRLSPHRHLSCT